MNSQLPGNWGAVPDQITDDIIKKRLREGCIIPSIPTVSKTALRALEENTCRYLPYCLYGARRAEVLSKIPNNTVPESVIIECMVSDSTGEYLSEYSSAARKSLKQFGTTSAKLAKRVVLHTYWEYMLKDIGISSLKGCKYTGKIKKPIEQKRMITTLLLYSTFGEKGIVKRPFNDEVANMAYRTVRKDLVVAMDSVQKYLYYMRPDDPMNRSDDTAFRLEDLLSYVGVLYKILLYFMDKVDEIVIKNAGRSTSSFEYRETELPEKLFVKYVRNGLKSYGRAGMAAMFRFTHNSIMSLMKICSICSQSSWRQKAGNVFEGIVAAVDLITFVHHHCQYIVNLTLVGYVCWLKGGINDHKIVSAIKQQWRFCHYLGKLAPTATSQSWSSMEVGTEMWFNMAVALSMMKHSGPTNHYLLTTELSDKRSRQKGQKSTFNHNCGSPGCCFSKFVLPGNTEIENGYHATGNFSKLIKIGTFCEQQSKDHSIRRNVKNGLTFLDCDSYKNPKNDSSAPCRNFVKLTELSSVLSCDPKSLSSCLSSPSSEKTDNTTNNCYSYWYMDKSFDKHTDMDMNHKVKTKAGSGQTDDVTYKMYSISDGEYTDSSICRENNNECVVCYGNYVTMEDIEKCRLQQMTSDKTEHSSGLANTENVSYNGNIAQRKMEVFKPSLVPGRSECCEESKHYDIPRKIVLSKVVTVVDNNGCAIHYDVPPPIRSKVVITN